MGGYGYRFQSYTAFATMGSKTTETFGPVTLFPNSDVSSEDYYGYDNHSPRQILVPVATKPYYDDDYNHGSPTKAYPAGYDARSVHVHGRPQGGDGFLPKRTMVPVASRPSGGYEYPNSPTKPYHVGEDDKWYSRHRDDELLIEGAGVPAPVASRPPFGVDGYGHGSPKKANPARDDGKSPEVLTKRTVVPVSTRANGREYERSSPPARTDPARHDSDNKWTGIQKAPASQPVIWTEWRRPQHSTAYNNGIEEEPKAIVIDSPNKSGKPIISQEWSSSPRRGTDLSEATDDIDKVAEMLIQNVRLALSSEGEYKSPKHRATNAFPLPNNDSRDRRNLGVDRPTPASPTSHGVGSPINAGRRFATINSREAERIYNGERV